MTECTHENWEVLLANKRRNGTPEYAYNYDNGVDAKRKEIRGWCRDCGAIHVYKKNEQGQWRDEWRLPGVQPKPDKSLADIVRKKLKKVDTEDAGYVWAGCGHKSKPVILDNNPLSVATYMEWYEDNPERICLECWTKKYLETKWRKHK